MTIHDLDIERSVSVLIDARGYDGAVTHAAAMIVVMEGEGDDAGGMVWRRIAAAIRDRHPRGSGRISMTPRHFRPLSFFEQFQYPHADDLADSTLTCHPLNFSKSKGGIIQ